MLICLFAYLLLFVYSPEFNHRGDHGLPVPSNIPIDIFVFSFRF